MRWIFYIRKTRKYYIDIKPSNILLDDKDNTHLTDFGIAKQEGDIRLTSTSDRLGSLPYMAPEVVRGERAGPETDRFCPWGDALHEANDGALAR